MESNGKLEEPTPEKPKKPNCLQKCGSFLSGGLEKFYYKLGVEIAKRPIITITVVLIACLACTAGLAKFYEVDASDPIWVDPKSMYMVHKKWVEEKFPSQIRQSLAIAESDSNILTPSGLKELLDIHEKIVAIKEKDYAYEQICSKFGRGTEARCWSSSILELWDFNRTIINGLSSSDIIFKVNNATKSPVTNSDFDVSSYLGGLTKDGSGKVTEAKAALCAYFMQGTNSSNSEFVTEDEVTKLTEKFELKFVEVTGNHSGPLIKPVHAFTTRSFGDEVGSSIFGDVYMLSAGYFLIIIYVALILGRFNCVEMRVYLALGGVLAVGLSIAVSFGLSSAFGIGYGPVQSILPFLLLGLGVDDAFVIVQSWNRLTAAQKELPIIEQSGHALKHAGVSITVTSITDIVAFGIGATTVLPALKDFCIYATIGIIAVFIIQATFFSACVVLDERRRKANRNGCCCCYAHKDDYQPNRCSQRDLQQHFFERFYGPFLIKLPVKITAVVISLALLAIGIYGVVFLKQEYDPNSFIPKDSYVKTYFDAYDQYFPSLGTDSGYVYIHDVNYNQEYKKISEMTEALKLETSVDNDTVDSWLESYADWLNTTSKCPWINSHINSTTKWPKSERSFNILLTPYIFMSAAGRRHITNVKFNETVEFGDGDDTRPANVTQIILNNNITNPNLTTPDILELEREFAGRYIRTSRIEYSYKTLASSYERVEAMDDTRAAVNSHYPDDNVFAFSRSFETWETDKIIQKELYRNLGLAFGCVVILTLLLIADIGTCILVSICVLSTLVEVGGFMYLWGLTIDTVTCIQLVLAIGLAVDYSAHIGHTFMTVTGTRNKRAEKTMADIGPAVFNGGFSTLLAFLLLANSASYVFDVFFRVNLLVVLLGVWNGMVLLPILLSFMGPPPYLSAYEPVSTSQIKAEFPDPAGVDNYALENEKPMANSNQEDSDKPHENGVSEPKSQAVSVAEKEGNSVGDASKSLTPPSVASGNVKDMPDVV